MSLNLEGWNKVSIMSYNLNVQNDGVKFINVYSQGQTRLGRELSNFHNSVFVHPKHGKFGSVEAAYYFFLTGSIHPRIKMLSGARAKSEGSKLVPREWRKEGNMVTEFLKDNVRYCIQLKLKQNRDILYRLISTDLPLEHFYVDGDKITNKNQHKWILDEINRIRRITKKWYLEKHGKLPNIDIFN